MTTPDLTALLQDPQVVSALNAQAQPATATPVTSPDQSQMLQALSSYLNQQQQQQQPSNQPEPQRPVPTNTQQNSMFPNLMQMLMQQSATAEQAAQQRH